MSARTDLATPLLSVKNLTIDILSAHNTQTVVHDVSFDLEKGRTLGIVGESGSGKSLTANAIMGILPDVAAAKGSITYNGTELLGLRAKERQSLSGPELGYIFQEPMSALHPTLSIGDQMIRPMRKHLGISRNEAKQRAIELLVKVGIPPERHVLGAYVHQLSGGMRQRVMIAMSISCDPKLLIADEPTTALDATIQKQILELLVELRESLGLSMILISHDLGLISEYSDDVVVMLDGYEMEQGRTADVVANPSSGYTAGLLQAAPRLGEKRDRLPVMDRAEFTKLEATS
ncbi:ABC transporter ATP-binding protein [Humidisolicoccus flavus]|uniref:ABC transporter ATP-binding protein n=1 Tax=Humidisolicoccus flavus TaxID=3111414 RepID=UPI00324EBBAA